MGEEIANSISHGIGAIIGIVFLILMIIKGVDSIDHRLRLDERVASSRVSGDAYEPLYRDPGGVQGEDFSGDPRVPGGTSS